IQYHVAFMVVREIVIVGIAIKRELQNSHEWRACETQQFANLFSSQSEIFGYQTVGGDASDPLFQQIHARACDPFPLFGTFCLAGYRPICGETAKMIQPQSVKKTEAVL